VQAGKTALSDVPNFEGEVTTQGRWSRRSVISSLFPAVMMGSSLAIGGKPALAAQNNAVLPKPSAVSAPFPWKRLLSELAVTAGPYCGAFRAVPNGPINWYFANLGLAFFTDAIPDTVRNYLDQYIKSLNSRSVITDVAPDLSTPVAPDSHDAYAGTFLSLAVRYVRATGDSAWWKMNLGSLKALAYFNLLTQTKPNGLVRVFQSPQENGTGYLMDQCEVYAGLRDFGQYLIESDDVDAGYYSSFAMSLGIAIHTIPTFAMSIQQMHPAIITVFTGVLKC
jgi:hypothetical protein